MTETTKRTRTPRSRKADKNVAPLMSAKELARLGGGQIAYIKHLTSDEAHKLFPAIEGLPRGIDLFSLHAADGTPLAITDTHRAAVEHAIGDELEIATLH
jgi:hypothetical protein